MRTAIAGATGLVGGHVVRYSGADIVALVRRQTPGLEARQHIVDFERLEDAHLSEPLERVYCTLGTTIRKAGSQEAFRKVDYDYVLAVGRWARGQGAQEFRVVSSVGADAESSNFYLRVKGEMERDLAKLGFLSLVIYRPSLLLGERGEMRPGEMIGKVLATMASPLMIGPLEKYRPVQAAAVGRAMVMSPEGPGVHIRHYPF